MLGVALLLAAVELATMVAGDVPADTWERCSKALQGMRAVALR